MRRVGQYFVSLYEDWVARMSGIASVTLAILALVWPHYFSDIHHLRAAMWIAAAACLILASFRIWLHERKALEAEVVKHEGSRIEGEIRLGYIDGKRYIPRAANYWEDFTLGCLVTLYIDATNKNLTEARLRSPNTRLELSFMGTAYIGEWNHLVEGLTFDDARVSVKAQACDFHNGMYFSRGMIQGLPKLGYLQFFVPNFPTDVLFGKEFLTVGVTITLTDTLDKLHIIRGVSVPLLVGKMARLGDVLEKAKSTEIGALIDVLKVIRDREPE